MKKILIVIFVMIFLAAGLATAVQAQTATDGVTHFGILEVDIRPEFDTPEVLVIYHIVLPAGVEYPAQVTIPLPAGVSQPNAVAWVDPADSGLYTLAYTTRVEGETTYVTFSTTGDEVWFEYYDPAISRDGDNRTYAFNWAGDFQVDAFNFFLLPPADATDVLLTPDMGAAQKDSNGASYYFKELGSLQAGNTFTITAQYARSTNAISAQDATVQPAAPLDDSTQGRTSISEFLPWLAGLLVLILAGFIGWWAWASRHNSSQVFAGEHRHNRAQHADGDFIYCHQCGERAGPSDVFCHSCGIKLRR
jgi:hypothetical protein